MHFSLKGEGDDNGEVFLREFPYFTVFIKEWDTAFVFLSVLSEPFRFTLESWSTQRSLCLALTSAEMFSLWTVIPSMSVCPSVCLAAGSSAVIKNRHAP